MTGKELMGRIRGSHRSSDKPKSEPKTPKRERRTEGPPPEGEHVAMRNANRFISQQQRKHGTGHGNADHGNPR